MDLGAVELRVLGCLIEKQRTTPDVYPLSLNALRTACNQSTNRDPVVSYDEPTIRAALDELSRRGWVRLASGPGSRAAKYRHLLTDALGLSDAEISLLAVLMLRGPQTPGRAEAAHRAPARIRLAGRGRADAHGADRARAGRPAARRPGQKEERYAHRLGAVKAGEPAATGAQEPARPLGLEERVARLEAEVRRLQERLDSG